MSPELLQRVFEPFVQGGSGSPRGLGVGLAVARQLVELHRGRIRVESSGPGREYLHRVDPCRNETDMFDSTLLTRYPMPLTR